MGGDRWGCIGAPPPVVVVVVVVVVAQGLRGDVLLKDCSVRHATSLSPNQTLPEKTKQEISIDCTYFIFEINYKISLYFIFEINRQVLYIRVIFIEGPRKISD